MAITIQIHIGAADVPQGPLWFKKAQTKQICVVHPALDDIRVHEPRQEPKSKDSPYVRHALFHIETMNGNPSLFHVVTNNARLSHTDSLVIKGIFVHCCDEPEQVLLCPTHIQGGYEVEYLYARFNHSIVSSTS